MDPFLFFGGIVAAATTGFSLSLGSRIIPIASRAARDSHAWKAGSDSDPGCAYDRQLAEVEARRERADRLERPPGRKRSSSIVGLHDDALRRADGSYVRAYH